MLKKIKLYPALNFILSLLVIYLLPVILTLRFHKSVNSHSILSFIFGLVMLLYLHIDHKFKLPSLILEFGISGYLYFTFSKPLGLIFLSILLLMISIKHDHTANTLHQIIYILILFLFVLNFTILQIHLISKTTILSLIFPFFTVGLFIILSEFKNIWLTGIILLLLNLYFFINYLTFIQITLYLLVIILLSLRNRLKVIPSLEAYLLTLIVITLI